MFYSSTAMIVCRYVPYVGDSKRAMDEYTSEIFLGGKVRYLPLQLSINTIKTIELKMFL